MPDEVWRRSRYGGQHAGGKPERGSRGTTDPQSPLSSPTSGRKEAAPSHTHTFSEFLTLLPHHLEVVRPRQEQPPPPPSVSPLADQLTLMTYNVKGPLSLDRFFNLLKHLKARSTPVHIVALQELRLTLPIFMYQLQAVEANYALTLSSTGTKHGVGFLIHSSIGGAPPTWKCCCPTK